MARNRIHNYLHNKRIATCEQLLSDLRLEREWRALEACEYALPVLERDLSEIVERDVLDAPQFNDLPRDDKARMREAF